MTLDKEIRKTEAAIARLEAQLSELKNKSARLRGENWWPRREDWPALEDEGLWDEALALLFLEEFVSLSWQDGGFSAGLTLSDVFGYGCADVENLPCPTSPSFWSLYHAVREHGWAGAIRWAVIKRQEAPIEPVVKSLKASGVWCDQMEEVLKCQTRG
mgnify:CR=1 FL=1